MGFLVYYALLFISGAFVGSFLNVVSDRLINGEPILLGRSHCEFCKKPLTPKNLIPLISFLVQGGKCSSCKTKLSWYYPFSEVLTGLVFVFSAYYAKIFEIQNFNSVWQFVFLLPILSIFVIVLLTDLKYLLIPDVVTIIGIVLAFIISAGGRVLILYNLYSKLAHDTFGTYLLKVGYFDLQVKFVAKNYGIHLLSALAIALFFYFLVWVTKEKGMGSGDIKLGLLVGLFNYFPLNLLAVFLGFLFGAIYSIVLIILGKKSIRDTVPFGPFLILASVVSLVWGNDLLGWYIHLLK